MPARLGEPVWLARLAKDPEAENPFFRPREPELHEAREDFLWGPP